MLEARQVTLLVVDCNASETSPLNCTCIFTVLSVYSVQCFTTYFANATLCNWLSIGPSLLPCSRSNASELVSLMVGSGKVNYCV